MTSPVRRLGIVALLAGLSAPAAAASRAQFVAGSNVPGYFAPEVARAITDALDKADAPDTDVSGRIEELPGGRVRLTATVRGKGSSAPLVVEGAFEELDALCVQLASKVYPLIAAAPERSARESTRSDKPDKRGPLLASVAVPVLGARDVKSTPVPTTVSTKPPVSTTPAPATPPATPTPPVTTTAPAAPVATVTPVSATPAESPARRRADEELLHPYARGTADEPARATAAPATTSPYFVRNRVVAHAIADVPAAWPGAGRSATQAFYYFLGRRLRLSIVPTGIGLVPLQAAADEGVRSAARGVVMARLLQVEDRGVSLRCRLELVVIKEGAVALRRIVEAEAMRRVQEDPLFVATAQALEAAFDDVNSAVAELR